MKKAELETGAASIVIHQHGSQMKVIHDTNGQVLATLRDAPSGSYDKIWDTLTELGFKGEGIDCHNAERPRTLRDTFDDLSSDMRRSIEIMEMQYGLQHIAELDELMLKIRAQINAFEWNGKKRFPVEPECGQPPPESSTKRLEYDIYINAADDGDGGDMTNMGLPLKTFDEWLDS